MYKRFFEFSEREFNRVMARLNAPFLSPFKPGLCYLAIPYSHPDAKVRKHRFQIANRMAASLMAQGHYVFSPISHTHPIAQAGALPGDWEYWEGYDTLILKQCTRLVVVKLEGWKESKGVSAEIKIAKRLGLPIEYLKPAVI